MTKNDLRYRVAEIQWFHSIDLGNGIITPGMYKDPQRKLIELGFPDNMEGKTVLDVGAWDGFFSFEAERRGAARVLATDSFCWNEESWGSKKGFLLAREALQSRVEDKTIDVMDLSPELVGTFDVVLFLGVLYHLRHPLLALEVIASVTRDLLILETETDLVDLRLPAMAYYPDKELNNDPTNWWAPNPAALCAMLKTVGFRRTEIVHHPRSRLYRLAKAFKQWLSQGKNPLVECSRDRIVVHAWKQ